MATVSVSKARAAEVLDVSPRTIDRMIGRGELETEREQGGRHRVLVRVDVDQAEEDARDADGDTVELAVLRERNRGLEDRVRYMNERLGMSDALNIELNNHIQRLTLALPPPKGRPWWKFW